MATASTIASRADKLSSPKIFALADTHLGFGVEKTMDKFGSLWFGHAEKIRERTNVTVGPDDILLLPGDLSWATKRHDAVPDLAYLNRLPGKKIAIKGNHDYWWESDRPINYPGLLSPPVIIEDGAIGFAGTRGWNEPDASLPTYESDKKTFAREQKRLQKSLDAIANCETKIALLHYPPQPFLPQLSAAGVHICVYGHVHQGSLPQDEKLAVFDEVLDGVRCYCVACDRIDFTPVLVFGPHSPFPSPIGRGGA